MEEKINIADILKDKSQGTKLYDWLHNIDVELDTISTTDTETVVWCTNETNNNTICHRGYSEFGTERGYPDGLQILFPSKEMRDWTKFSWKKGDVLIGDCGFVCIFKEWASDDYTRFNGCYFDGMPNAKTAKYSKLDNNTAYSYIRKLENRCGGKLNPETLKIEKQLEFKDGDIVVYGKSVAICRRLYKHTLSFYVSLNEMVGLLFADEVESSEEYRFATEEEKQQLFDALEKEGKAWDAEKKQIVDLKPKVELKSFDNVLVRHQKTEEWRANIFSHTDKTDEYLDYVCVNGRWEFCIPYEGNESLLGTTNNVEG